MEYRVIMPVEVKITIPRKLSLKREQELGEIVQGRVERLLQANILEVPFAKDQIEMGPASVQSVRS